MLRLSSPGCTASKCPRRTWRRIATGARRRSVAPGILWRVDADSVAVGKRMRRVLPPYNIHVCGEAYSGIQAFIEGALTSTELVLQEQLGLDSPDWLAEDYYLGPR